MKNFNLPGHTLETVTVLEPVSPHSTTSKKLPKKEIQGVPYYRVKLNAQVPDKRSLPKSDKNLKWPEFKNDKERIKAYAKRFSDTPITDAFQEVYDVNLNLTEHQKTMINMPPVELKAGQVVTVGLMGVDKHKIDLDGLNLKQQVSCSVNLSKYQAFKNFKPIDSVKLKVVSSTHDKVVVDPLTPILEDWITPILKDNACQKVIKNPQTIEVRNLKLIGGGFIGQAVVPGLSKFLGEPYTVEAFIPGSQIVLNIESDFTKWEGKTVKAFVTNYIQKPGAPNQMSLICSVKEYLKFQGEKNLIDLFNLWCDTSDEWKKVSQTPLEGRVTGIINSSKKCGAFVEIPSLNITGMVNLKPERLVEYKPGTAVKVNLCDFEENVYFDDSVNQLQHEIPYQIEDGVLVKCNLKPVFKFSE